MKIVLKLDGKDKTFSVDFIKARTFRKALELNKTFRNGAEIGEVETYDSLVDFVVFAFDNQFSNDQVWDGLNASQVQSEPMRVFNEVLNLGGLMTTPSTTDGEVETEGK